MSEAKFYEIISSRFWLNFKDSKLEKEYQKDREKITFQRGRKFYFLFLPLMITMLLAIVGGRTYEDQKTLKQDKDDCQITFTGRSWAFYMIPLIIFIWLIELLISQAPPCIKRFRGIMHIISMYALIGEPTAVMFGDLLPIFAVDRTGMAATNFLMIQAIFIECINWRVASIANVLGVIALLYRVMSGTQLPFPEFIILIFFCFLFALAVYFAELEGRKRFYMIHQIQMQEKQWKDFVDKIPASVILLNQTDKSVVYRNRATDSIFQSPPNNEFNTEEREGIELTRLRSTINEEHQPNLELIPLADIETEPQVIYTSENIREEDMINNTFVESEIRNFVAHIDTRLSTSEIGGHEEEIEWETDTRTSVKKYLLLSSIELNFNEAICTAIILRDKTNEKLIELEKLKTAKEKEIFFASMSHELRNPLNALLGCLEMMKDSINESNRNIFEIAKTCGDTLYNLIGNILDISKIENNKIELQPTRGCLRDSIGRVVAMSQTLADQKGIFLKIIWSPQFPPFLLFDHPRITQIFINIISNSIKFTDRGGVVIKADWFPITLDHQKRFILGPNDPLFLDIISNSELEEYASLENRDIESIDVQSLGEIENSTENAGTISLVQEETKENEQLTLGNVGYIKLQIIDSGCGISQSEMDKLFQPFGQASHSTKYGGTGLGLWISRQFMALMKGNIKIFSQQRLGSNFVSVFPCQISQNINVPTNKASSINLNYIQEVRCLYVEDEDYNRKIVKEMLERLRLIVYTAENGRQGLNIYKDNPQNHFDLIFTDLRMPVMSGQDMIYAIRKYEKENLFKTVPIVIISAEPSDLEIDKCINQLKANIFISKPINLNKIQDAITNVLNPHNSNVSEVSQKSTILIVDDDIFSSEMTFKLLTNKGFTALKAFSIEEGYNIFLEEIHTIKIVILDSELPDGRGTDLAKLIRKFESENNLLESVILFSISGNDKKTQAEDYQGIEINEFFEKPIKIVEFASLVSKYLDHQQF